MKTRKINHKSGEYILCLDDEDFNLLSEHKLSIQISRKKPRVMIHIDKSRIYLHKFLLNVFKEYVGVNDNNYLNCQRNNLFIYTDERRTTTKRIWYEENRENIIKKSNVWVKNNPERHKMNQRKYRATPKAKKTKSEWRKLPRVRAHYNAYYVQKSTDPKRRFTYSKNKAIKNSHEWSLTLEQYTDLINKPCFYSGESLLDEMGRGLDRIDNSKGYTLDNVLPCIGWVNKIRNNILTVEETKIAVEAILKFRTSNCYKDSDDGLVDMSKPK